MNYNGSATPNAYLLRGDCLGCHAQNTSSNIVNTIPQVLHTAATDLAGGNFRYGTTTDANVHNVVGIFGSADGILGSTPPGYLAGYDPASTQFSTSTRLNCAGSNGCHGNRDNTDRDAAIFGGHHADDSVLKFGFINESNQGATVGTSYRFLYHVHGGENTSWLNTNGTSHNEYKGAVYSSGRETQTQSWSDIVTISSLCAECHGKFHAGGLTGDSGIGTGSPWLRHPTDAVIPNSGEYASITTTNGYNVETPVGRTSIPTSAPSADVALGTTDVVICISCHAAHGTSYADILRWNYTVTMGAGSGCLRCHTGKTPY
jgi:cytochrome c553